MTKITEIWAQECRDEMEYYRSRAAECRAKGMKGARRTYIELALKNRFRARRWDLVGLNSGAAAGVRDGMR